mmetsp:Transcript_41938/g.67446  ORF Transcript_41938/g.67446 Transcript_41938/m.67446 type:complete len:200 (-) Transcript_41938:1785-2384(-)
MKQWYYNTKVGNTNRAQRQTISSVPAAAAASPSSSSSSSFPSSPTPLQLESAHEEEEEVVVPLEMVGDTERAKWEEKEKRRTAAEFADAASSSLFHPLTPTPGRRERRFMFLDGSTVELAVSPIIIVAMLIVLFSGIFSFYTLLWTNITKVIIALLQAMCRLQHLHRQGRGMRATAIIVNRLLLAALLVFVVWILVVLS